MLATGQVQLAFIGGLGPTELIVIFLIVLLVFGAKRIPEIAQGLGKGIKEFKNAAKEITDEFDANNAPPIQNQNQNQNYARNELRPQRSEKPAQEQNQNQNAQQNTDA